MKLTNPLSPDVNTQKIINSFATKDVIIRDEIKKVNDAVKKIQDYFLMPTPKWKIEPVIDEDTNQITKEGIEQDILTQFDPINKKLALSSILV